MTADTGNHGHGHTPIGDALLRTWDEVREHLPHHDPPSLAAQAAAARSYEQMKGSRCHAADLRNGRRLPVHRHVHRSGITSPGRTAG